MSPPVMSRPRGAFVTSSGGAVGATSALAISAPIQKLQVLVSNGKSARPDLASRLERAAMIVALRAIRRLPDGTYLVESEQKPGRFYRVAAVQCQCIDHSRAPGGWCKHRLAVRLHVALARSADDRENSDVSNAPAEAKMARAQRTGVTRSRRARCAPSELDDHPRTARGLSVVRLVLLEAAVQFCASQPVVSPGDVVRVAMGWERWLQQG